MSINIKRAYQSADKSDGYRILVDRLWPRGIKKEDLDINEWYKDIAPSNDLRKWFGHDPSKFDGFKSKYIDEVKQSGAIDHIKDLASKHNTITLVYSAKDEEHNQAVVLKEYLG